MTPEELETLIAGLKSLQTDIFIVKSNIKKIEAISNGEETGSRTKCISDAFGASSAIHARLADLKKNNPFTD